MLYETVGPRPTKLGVNISHIVSHLYLEFENSSCSGSWSPLLTLKNSFFRIWPPCREKRSSLFWGLRPQNMLGAFGASRGEPRNGGIFDYTGDFSFHLPQNLNFPKWQPWASPTRDAIKFFRNRDFHSKTRFGPFKIVSDQKKFFENFSKKFRFFGQKFQS